MENRYLTKKDADMFICDRDALVELYGEEIFYKIAKSLRINEVADKVVVYNDGEKHTEYLNAGYPILQKDIDFNRYEEKMMDDWHCHRYVLCKGTQFLVMS